MFRQIREGSGASVERLGGENTGMTASIRQVVVASFIGTRVRYSGASFAYQISGIFGGALAPIIAAILYPVGGTTLISIYIAALCALSVLCYVLAAETYRKDIYEEDPEERRLVAEQG